MDRRPFVSLLAVLLLAGAVQGQGEASLFDGKTTSSWLIQGDAEVLDGVLVLGGKRKTNARPAVDFGPRFEYRLEYRTENAKPIQVEWHHRHWLGEGMGGMTMGRTSKNPEEWLEAVFAAKEHGNGWRVDSKLRAVGEAAFVERELGGSSSVPGSAFIAFEIPAGQRLYLRKVSATFEPPSTFPWVPIVGVVVVVVLALVAWIVVRKRKTPKRPPPARQHPL